MQIKYISIYVLLASSILFHSCDVNDSTNTDYSRSIENNGIIVFIRDGAINSPGEIKVVNTSLQKIHVPFILFPYCNFSIYSLEKKTINEWEQLSYNEFQNKWLEKTTQDSIIAVCDEYRNPIVINSSQSFKHIISNLEKAGEYQLKIHFRFSDLRNPNTPDKEIVISYFVN